MRDLLLVFLGGGSGSVCRWLVGLGLARLPGGGLPLGTLAANVLGCLVIGLVAGALNRDHHAPWVMLLATGFCGGFTTFSSFILEKQRLLADGQWGIALVYLGLSVVLGFAALAAGLWLAGARGPVTPGA